MYKTGLEDLPGSEEDGSTGINFPGRKSTNTQSHAIKEEILTSGLKNDSHIPIAS